MSHRSGLYATDGTEQRERFAAALAEGYFRPDEMSFEDLVGMATRLARHLHYYDAEKAAALPPFADLSAARQGTWEDLFASDEAVVMARILGTRPARLRAVCLERLEIGPQHAAEYLYAQAQQMAAWHDALRRVDHRAAVSLAAAMDDVFARSLRPELAVLRPAVEAIAPGSTGHWQLASAGVTAVRGPVRPPMPPAGTPAFRRWAADTVRGAMDAFAHALEYLQAIVPRYLADSLVSQRHNPAVALFIAFLRMYARAQAGANALTGRHLALYYEKRLRATPRPPVADAAWLVLTAAPGVTDVPVPAATAFSAGRDADGRDVVFLTTQPLRISDAQVRDLRTLRLERDRLISPERELGYVNRARVHRFLATAGYDEMWPIFGAEEKESCRGAAGDAEFGFAIASPVLLLREGERSITFDLHLSDPGDMDLGVAIAMTHLGAEPDEAHVVATLSAIFAQFLVTQPEFRPADDREPPPRRARLMAESIMQVPGALARFRRLFAQGRQDGVYDAFLLALLRQAETPAAFFAAFGRIFRRHLLRQSPNQRDGLGPDECAAIRECARRLLADARHRHALVEVERLLAGKATSHFYRLLKQAFVLSFTGETGWVDSPSFGIAPCPTVEHVGELGLRCIVHLGPDAPAIVGCQPALHGEVWQTDLPLARFRLNPLADVFHYSFFEGLRLRDATIEARAERVRTLVAFNAEGRLDPARPFMPFGAVPGKGAYVVIGSHEIASKPITQLQMEVEWGGLPVDLDGFPSYYRGYDTPVRTDAFQVDVAVLRDGEWQPAEAERRAVLPLFVSREGGRVHELRTLPLEAAAAMRPVAVREDEFTYDVRARSGFIRLTLTAPDGAFGHRDYAALMTRRLAENSRTRKPKALPNAPYTPLVNRVTLSYTAREVILASTDPSASDGADRQRVFQLHPFGIRRIYPSDDGNVAPLVPTYRYEGNLFIGLSASQPAGVQTLFFHMAEDSARDLSPAVAELAWFYLAGNRWRRLEASRVLSDTTHGFLRSGVVTLDLPADMSSHNTVMPAGLFWLSVGARGDVGAFASLYGVHTHGVMATRLLDDDRYAGERLPEGTIRQPVVSIPGLASVQHIQPTFGGRGREDALSLKTRMSERLRHRNRATTAWDYERLLLDRFPDVFKAKCFPNVVMGDDGARPGHVLVVAVPGPREHSLSPRIDALELARMRDYLQERCSPHVHVDVRNPVYERIQVRCAVKFRAAGYPGLDIQRLNEAIVDFLSPWSHGGYRTRFGWCVRRDDMEAFVRGLDYVDYVTDFSMLHITDQGGDDFALADTARFWPVTVGSVIAMERLALALKRAEDRVSAFLREALAPATRAALEAWPASAVVPPDLADALLADVNSRLAGASLYEAERFAGVVLQEDTRRRLEASPAGPAVVALNRLLLEDCYPGVFAASPARTEEIRPRSPWSIAVPTRTHAIEPIGALKYTAAEPTGIAELEVVSSFIIS